jgi:hypothetical protein
MSAPEYDVQSATRNSVNFNIKPGNVNPPVVFEPSDALAGGLIVWIGASGGKNCGGCHIWVSEDNFTYKILGEISNPARQGILTSPLAVSAVDPDKVNTLSVDLSMSDGTLSSGTLEDADSLNTLCFVDGELISYETATLTAKNKYDLNYLRRGAYDTAITSHNANTQFMRIDKDTLFSYPFSRGIVLRILTIILVLIPFYILKHKGYRYYTKFINTVCIIYSLVFIFHLNWILRACFIL